MWFSPSLAGTYEAFSNIHTYIKHLEGYFGHEQQPMSVTGQDKRSTVVVASLGASASSAVSRAAAMSRQVRKYPTTQKTLFEDTKKIITGLNDAVAFLWQCQLILPGSDAESCPRTDRGLQSRLGLTILGQDRGR